MSPYGQRTTLTLNGSGYLAAISDPASETINLAYLPPVAGDAHSGGLLSQLTDARGGIHAFAYDATGFLTKDTPPDGAFQALDRHGLLNPSQVTHTTALGRTTTYSVTWSGLVADTETSKVTNPAGLTTTTVTNRGASSTTTYPDTSTTTTSAMPDPRFGMDAPAQTVTTKTPSGLTRTVSESRTATMAGPQDPITLNTLVQQVSLNGKSYTSTYDSVAKTITLRSPVGRQAVMTLDASGRVAQVQPPGISPVTVHYDLRGRVDSTTQGTRSYAYALDTFGRVQSITDPLHTRCPWPGGPPPPRGPTRSPLDCPPK